MKNSFKSKLSHFQEGVEIPKIEKILEVLLKAGILDLDSGSIQDWRGSITYIVPQLRVYLSKVLMTSKGSNQSLELIFELSEGLKNEVSWNNDILNLIFSNGIKEEHKDKIKLLDQYRSTIFAIKSRLDTNVARSMHTQSLEFYLLEMNEFYLGLFKGINDLIKRIERIDSKLNRNLERYHFDFSNQDETNLKSIRSINSKIDIVNNLNEGDEDKYPSRRRIYQEFRYDNDGLEFDKNENLLISKEIINIIYELNSKLGSFKTEELSSEITKLSSQQDIKFGVNEAQFISALISRIDILDAGEKKRTFIDKFESKKSLKSRISLVFLFLSGGLFSFVAILNWLAYNDNINTLLTISQFVSNLLGHGIYLIFFESILVALAFYFLGLFRTYSKIVEIYDSHILLIESDFYYKDDKDLSDLGIVTFNLRKENTQKIHSLPDRAFDMLNGKNEIKTEMPLIKAIDRLGEILISSKSLKKDD